MADLKEFQRKMEKTLDVLASDFAAVRAGRANAQVLDRITVEYYGQPSPINQVGTVASPDPRTLVIQPWDGSLLKAIEKAIQTSDLGINPQNDGRVIRLVFPQLTEERRKDLTKQVRKYAEDAKVAVRNIRRDAVDYVKKAQKKGELTEDDQKGHPGPDRQARQEDRRDVRQEGKGTDGDLSAAKRLAEFAPAGANKIELIFDGSPCSRQKYCSPANVNFGRYAAKTLRCSRRNQIAQKPRLLGR